MCSRYVGAGGCLVGNTKALYHTPARSRHVPPARAASPAQPARPGQPSQAAQDAIFALKKMCISKKSSASRQAGLGADRQEALAAGLEWGARRAKNRASRTNFQGTKK